MTAVIWIAASRGYPGPREYVWDFRCGADKEYNEYNQPFLNFPAPPWWFPTPPDAKTVGLFLPKLASWRQCFTHHQCHLEHSQLDCCKTQLALRGYTQNCWCSGALWLAFFCPQSSVGITASRVILSLFAHYLVAPVTTYRRTDSFQSPAMVRSHSFWHRSLHILGHGTAGRAMSQRPIRWVSVTLNCIDRFW